MGLPSPQHAGLAGALRVHGRIGLRGRAGEMGGGGRRMSLMSLGGEPDGRSESMKQREQQSRRDSLGQQRSADSAALFANVIEEIAEAAERRLLDDISEVGGSG